MRFKVNNSVLIPRPETEDLVRWVLDEYKECGKGCTILDIGTGSGCIAIALASSLPESRVYAIDVSATALETASKNASDHNVEITFRKADIRHLESVGPAFDIIVSNPPYVRFSEKNTMQPNVTEYEPQLALFVSDEDPLIYYRHIARFASENLKEGGALFLEINQYLGESLIKLLEDQKFSEIELRKDLFGNDRMIRAFKK